MQLKLGFLGGLNVGKIGFPAGGASDTTRPTVAITSTETSPTGAATIPLTITFSESVTGFVVGDITVVGCSLSGFAGSGTTYTVTATPTARSITVDIAQGVAADAAGNTNTAATQFAIIWEYAEKVKALFTTSILSYLPLWEASGAVADDYYSTNRDGAYSATGVTYGETGIGDGRTCVKLNGSAGYVNWYSAGLASAFSGAEGSALLWVKVSAAGIWTDGANHYLLMLKVDSNNNVYIVKSSVNGRLEFQYLAGGAGQQYRREGSNETGWMQIAITWSKSNNRVRCYVNGSQVGADQTGLGTWAGSLNSSATVIGSFNTTPANLWSGWEAHAVLLNREATGSEVLAFATLPF